MGIETASLLGHEERQKTLGAPVIELENVSYTYGDGELLSSVSVQLQPGSFHFLTGPSGAGKTTLLKLCYGALLPTSGRLSAFDQDISALDRDQMALLRRRVGVVHQDCQFLDHMTLAENVALPLMVSGRAEHAEQDNLTELLSWVAVLRRDRRNCRAGNGNAPRWHGLSPCRLMSFWRTSQPATWIGRCPSACCA